MRAQLYHPVGPLSAKDSRSDKWKKRIEMSKRKLEATSSDVPYFTNVPSYLIPLT